MLIDYMSKQEMSRYLSVCNDNLYLLLDSGRDENLLRTVYLHDAEPEFRTLLSLSAYEDAALRGPLVVKVSEASSLRAHFMADTNLGIMIISEMDIDQVTEYCADLFRQTVNQKNMFLRFYDPRVLVPLAACLSETSGRSFFGKCFKALFAIPESYHAVKIERQEDNSADTMEPSRFNLLPEHLQEIEREHAARMLELLDMHLAAVIPAYAGLNDEKQAEFLHDAKCHASMFGINEYDARKTFFEEWFYVSSMIKESDKAMKILASAETRLPIKLSYLNNMRIFFYNGSSLPFNPVAMLSRNDMYKEFPHRITDTGRRIPVSMISDDDFTPRLYYSSCMQKYTENERAIINKTKSLIKQSQYSELLKSYDIYAERYADIENIFCTQLKKELGYGA